MVLNVPVVSSVGPDKKNWEISKKDGNIYLISPTISYLFIPTNTFILLKTNQCSDQPNEMLLEVFQSSTKATTWHRMVINHHPSPSFQTVAKTCQRGAHTFTLFKVTLGDNFDVCFMLATLATKPISFCISLHCVSL